MNFWAFTAGMWGTFFAFGTAIGALTTYLMITTDADLVEKANYYQGQAADLRKQNDNLQKQLTGSAAVKTDLEATISKLTADNKKLQNTIKASPVIATGGDPVQASLTTDSIEPAKQIELNKTGSFYNETILVSITKLYPERKIDVTVGSVGFDSVSKGYLATGATVLYKSTDNYEIRILEIDWIKEFATVQVAKLK